MQIDYPTIWILLLLGCGVYLLSLALSVPRLTIDSFFERLLLSKNFVAKSTPKSSLRDWNGTAVVLIALAVATVPADAAIELVVAAEAMNGQ